MSDVIISKKQKGGMFHEPYCPYVKRIKKENRKQVEEAKAIRKGYCECKYCRSVKGLVYKYKNETDKDVSYDKVDDAFCVRTPVGFWKLIWRENQKEWHIFHMNHKGFDSFDPNASTKKLMRGNFHRQHDFKYSFSIKSALKYIESHDHNYKIAEENIRNMKRTTHKQRRDYQKQKGRKKKEAVRNVFKIFNKLEKERMNNE